MRVGRNPLTGSKVKLLPPLVAGVITHLPGQEGYHKERLEIIQICLSTLREHAGKFIPVMVWDNGSCPALRSWLLEEYKPEFLVLGPNIGKASARCGIIRAFPPETVVCISDEDMYFHPGWLEPQLKLLKHFPNVGQVSGYPVRTQFRWGTKSTMKWAEENGAKITRGRLIPEEWDRDFCTSVGREYDWHAAKTRDEVETLIEWKGVKAYATAHHCQFITLAGRIEFLVQWDGEAMGDERFFDKAIDAQGMLRLTTTERLVRHMGNVMEDWMRERN